MPKELTVFKELVERSLINKHNIPKEKALELINDSTFNDMLEEDPFFVTHYSAEYWVNDILEEHALLEP